MYTFSGPTKQVFLMSCYLLLAFSVLTMEIFVKWQQKMLKRNSSKEETSASNLFKKTGLFSAFTLVVLLVLFIWKANSKTDLQNFELAKDFAMFTTFGVFIPLNMIRKNANMKEYILRHIYNNCICLFVVHQWSYTNRKWHIRKENTVKPIVIIA